jgi:hypothetical protein
MTPYNTKTAVCQWGQCHAIQFLDSFPLEGSTDLFSVKMRHVP